METGQILGGQVSINQSCRISGEIDVEGEGLHTVQHAWMNKNKDMIIETVFSEGGYWDFSAVKK
jgi:hypothetical protein